MNQAGTSGHKIIVFCEMYFGCELKERRVRKRESALNETQCILLTIQFFSIFSNLSSNLISIIILGNKFDVHVLMCCVVDVEIGIT